MELIGTYPLILKGEEQGHLIIEKQGLFWHFYAKCPLQNEIIRLSIFSENEESYLGVMCPQGDFLIFEKKYSKNGIANFPQKIIYCGEKGISYVFPSEEEIIEEIEDIAPQDVEIKEDTDLFSPQEPETCKEDEAIAVNALADKLDFGTPSPLSGNFNQIPRSLVPQEAETVEVINEIPPQEETEIDDTEDAEPESKTRPPPIFSLENLSFLPCPCPSSLFSSSHMKSLMGNVSSAFICKTEDFTLFAVPENSFPHLLLAQNSLPLLTYELMEENFKIALIKDGNFVTEILE